MLSLAIRKTLSASGDDVTILTPMLEELEDSRDAVAARLRAAREALGLSKKEFAERADLSQQVYGPFENARRDLTIEAAKKIRKAHKLPLEFLYFGKIEDLPTRISSKL